MLRSNNGFFLLELLLSLSALFMVCLFFVPQLIEIKEQSRILEVEKKARQIMFEELQAKITMNQVFTNYSVSQNGVQYNIYWSAHQKEVCVRVEGDSSRPETEICGILE